MFLRKPYATPCRSLSWGGASPSAQELQARAQRIAGTKLTDDLSGGEDGAGDSDDEPWSRTPLENALAVRARPPPRG